MTWGNIFTPLADDDGFTFSDVLGMLLLDTVLYTALALYIDRVNPGPYGIPARWDGREEHPSGTLVVP